MRVAFLLEAPNIRGSGVASYDYAHFNEVLLNNESFFVFNRAHEKDFHPLGEKRISDRFPVFYLNQIDDLDSVLTREKIDFMYTIRTGHLEPGIPKSCNSGVHVMFQHYVPHGTVYAYVSEWLSLQARAHLGVEVPYVPHMVHGPRSPTINLRKRLRIPQDAVVFGRYGGFTQFDLKMAQRAVAEVVAHSKHHYFLFMNTHKFIQHPRVFFLPANTDLQNKCSFIHACDAMLHARRLGESFGMAIAEFLYQGKPVIAWKSGNDLNHLSMLGDKGIFYQSQQQLVSILRSFLPERHIAEHYRAIADNFSAEKTMAKFQQVFLSA